MDSMRAIVQHEFGGPDVLRVESRAVPEPVATEVRVRVEAAGVNAVDWKTRAGKGLRRVRDGPVPTLRPPPRGAARRAGRGVVAGRPDRLAVPRRHRAGAA